MLHKPATFLVHYAFRYLSHRVPRLAAGHNAILLLASLLSAPVALAAEDPLLDQLGQLLDASRYQAAYQLASDNLDQYEGDPDFDFLYGLAALETGHPSEAVFAFERLAFQYPGELRIKLELARALFQSNNLPASRQLFDEVLATNPAANVRNNIEAFLAQIDAREQSRRSRIDWYVRSNIGSDSNINSATELGIINTPIGDVELSANGQGIEDDFLDLGTGISYQRPLSKTRALGFSANYNQHNNFSTSDFDIDTLSADANYIQFIDNLRLNYGGRVQRIDLGGEHFQSSASLLAGVQRNPGNGWTQSLTAAWSTVRFDDGINANASLRDVDQALFSAALGKSQGRFYHALSVYYGDEQARRDAGKNNAQQFYGIAFSEQVQLLPGHVPYFRISLHHSDNKRQDPIFARAREDKIFSTSLGWIWHANSKIDITTDVTYTNNDSNIELFEYDRVKYQTGLRYQF